MKEKVISPDYLIIILIITSIIVYYSLFYRKIRDKLQKDRKNSKLLKNHPSYTTTSIHFMIILVLSLIIITLINKYYR